VTFIYTSVDGIWIVIGVVIGWLLSQIKLKRPKIAVDFENGNPCIREGQQSPSYIIDPTVRLVVKNEGKVEAKNCIVKMKISKESGEFITDSHILHWARRVPIKISGEKVDEIYQPITIASKDHEPVDWIIKINESLKVIGAEEKREWVLYSYPFVPEQNLAPDTFSLPKPTKLPVSQPRKNGFFKVEVLCYCDDIKPRQLDFFYSIQNDNLMVGKDKNQLKKITSCL